MQYFFLFYYGIKELNKLWKKTFRIIYHVYWDTLYFELVLTMDWIEIEKGVNSILSGLKYRERRILQRKRKRKNLRKIR